MTRPLVHCPVHMRRTIHPNANGSTPEVALTVHCPIEGRSIDVGECTLCARCRALPVDVLADDAEVLCDAPAREERPRAHVGGDLAAAAAQIPMYEIMRPALAVELEVSADVARKMLVRELDEGNRDRALTVVDGKNRPVGILSQTDFLREDGVKPLAGRTVAEVMTPVVHTLEENARLAHAFALMALEKIGQVPIVDDEGTMVGVFSASDGVAWLVQKMGYAP